MLDDLNELKTFRAILAEGSFSAAARRLGVTLAVVTAGFGIMLRSEIDVAEDLAAGRLERVLPGWDSGDAPIVALYPSAQFVPLKTRLILNELKAHMDAVTN